jgi:iron complex transport system substrate-binding protein
MNVKIRNVLVSLITIVILSLALTACSKTDNTSASNVVTPTDEATDSATPVPSNSTTTDSTTSDSKAATKVYTDMAGRQVELSTDIHKIISVRYMEVYMLAAILGDELDDKIISLGVSLKDNDNDGYKKLSENLDMDQMTEIGSIWDDNISVEKVLQLDPDIIIVDTHFQEKACVSKMIDAGLPVVFTDIGTDPIYGTLDSMKMLGEMLGKKDRVDEMVDYASSKMNALFDRIDTITADSANHPSIYFEQGTTEPSEISISQGDSSGSWGLLMDKLGAKNIGEGKGYVQLDPEEILSSDPDVIVVGGSNWSATDNIMRMGYYQTEDAAAKHLGEYITARDGWDKLSAVLNHRLYSVHFNAEVYPFSFAIFEALAQDIYPEDLSDLTPQADLEEFFTKYMPYSYSGTFFAKWK